MNQKKEQIKEVSFLVKLGCVFVIIPLVIICAFLTIFSLCCLSGFCITTTMIPDDVKNLGVYFFSSIIVAMTILFYVHIHVYIKIFQGKANDTVRMIFGIMAIPYSILFFGLPGLFIYLGRYEDKDINK
jgi:hypothetical protein